MRFQRVLEEVLGTGTKVALLRVLVRLGGEHTGRELSRLVDRDGRNCSLALEDLGRQGVVVSRRVGRARTHAINRSHVLVEQMLAPLFERERELLATAGREIRLRLSRRGIRPLALAAFGSVARREEAAADSDLDLLVLLDRDALPADRQAEAADDLSEFGFARYGMAVQVFFETVRSLRRKQERGDPLALSMIRDGILVHGRGTLKGLLRHG